MQVPGMMQQQQQPAVYGQQWGNPYGQQPQAQQQQQPQATGPYGQPAVAAAAVDPGKSRVIFVILVQ